MPEHRYDMSLHERMYKSVGEQVRAARRKLGISQAMLATLAGISKDVMMRIEKEGTTDFRRLAKVSAALGIAIIVGCDNPDVIKDLERMGPDWRPKLKGVRHGYYMSYKKGCRCSPCSRAVSEYRKINRLKKGKKVHAPLPKGWEHRADLLTGLGTRVNYKGEQFST